MQIPASCAETYETKKRRNLNTRLRLKVRSGNIPKCWAWQEKLVKRGVRSCSVCGLRTSRLVRGCLSAILQGSERKGETKTRRKRDIWRIKRMFVFACVWKANEFEPFFYVEKASKHRCTFHPAITKWELFSLSLWSTLSDRHVTLIPSGYSICQPNDKKDFISVR